MVFELIFRCDDAKIIKIILENWDEELSVEEISEMTDVDISDVYDYLKHLSKQGIINIIKLSPKKHMMLCKFNPDNYLSKALVLFEHEIVSKGLDKLIKETKQI